MVQRKLTDKELQKVLDGRHCLRKVLEFSKHVHYIGVALEQLDAIAIHCTTDGKPWIEPQPEIGDGYRLATASDIDRRDATWWDARTKRWEDCGAWSAGMPFDSGRIYRVPVDRIPTDEDAVGRPIVMAKDLDYQKFHPGRLIEVEKGADQEFYVRLNSDQASLWWDQCRFPYPGELD
jgi:hypothetical protein